MSPNGPTITLPKDMEEILAKMTPEEKKEFWEFVAGETDKLLAMSSEERKLALEDASERAAIVDQQLKLLAMTPEERAVELKKFEEAAVKVTAEAEKEWEEAVIFSLAPFMEEDISRRKAEAEIEKKVTAVKASELIDSFKVFLAGGNLAGCGVILKKLATSGRFGEILNYYGYDSNLSGTHSFFNEILIGNRPILGEKAFDNFLFQQKAYSIEHEVSCLAQGLNQWSLSCLMGRKGRQWYQMTEEEHLLAVSHNLKKIKPEAAARNFGRLAYGSETPFEKFRPEEGSLFEFGREGKLILMLFADVFEKQLGEKEFNPEAAEALYDVRDEFEALGLKSSFVEALGKYVEEIEVKPEKVEETWSEFIK